MKILVGAEKLMTMNERTWARHANPLSVYTRVPMLPLLALAIWSRVWLDWWALLPLAAVIAWTWVNPRAFPVPRDYDNWASKVVLGERLFLARKTQSVPMHHVTAGFLLSGLSAVGLPFMAWGLFVLDPWMTAFGTAIGFLGKLWFCDRMAWLYDDMAAADPAIRSRYEVVRD